MPSGRHAPIQPRLAAPTLDFRASGDGLNLDGRLTCPDAHDGVGAVVAPRAGPRPLDGHRPRARVAQKSAGLRTYTLVGLGSALFLLCREFGFFDELERGSVVLDPSRVAAQIVSGIGFIGGGLIFVRRDSVRGLTTAAGVWLAAAVGMAAGAGLAVLAVASTAALPRWSPSTYPHSRGRLPRSGSRPRRADHLPRRPGRAARGARARTGAGFDVSDVSFERDDDATSHRRGRGARAAAAERPGHRVGRARRRVVRPRRRRQRGPGLMRAITVIPGQAGSAQLDEVPEPAAAAGSLLVDGLALGICGTDGEIVRGEYGWSPAGEERLVLGHESLGRVLEAPEGSGFAAGDLVVGIVRRPDAVPCAPCAAGEWDFCANGEYTERGIKQLHGYGSERWRVEPEFAIRLDPGLEDVGVLLEPTSVVAKAWEQIERIGARATFAPRSVLVTGAGPIGLLAALLPCSGAMRSTCSTRSPTGRSPSSCARLGGTYHASDASAAGRVDIVVEATGARPGRRAGAARHDAQRDRLPHRRLLRRPPARLRHRRLQPRPRARERRRVRHRERQPPPLRGGGGGARRRRPRVAARADHPPRAARPLAGGARAQARTT